VSFKHVRITFFIFINAIKKACEMCFDVLIFGKDGCEKLHGPINKHTSHEEADQLTKPKRKRHPEKEKIRGKGLITCLPC
jgi:hypothetical protein